jgi:murein L,D-transpeptidase YcbB/YkuD
MNLSRRSALAAAAAAVGLGVAFRARAQNVAELIRVRVEELRATGLLAAHGAHLASRNLLPRIYENRAFEPAWRSVAQVDSLLALLDESYLEGLDPDDYHAATIRELRPALADFASLPPTGRADLDLLLTDSVIRVGYHLRFGKVEPQALDPHWNLSRELVGEDPARTIQAAIDAPSLREFAARFIPRVFLYERLKTALAEHRELQARGGWSSLPDGPTLRPGTADARVPALAARLAVTGDLAGAALGGDATRYEEPLVAAVRAFQARHGLAADGVVGPTTRAALNVPVAERIEQLRANLERARWLFYDPESQFLVVNIAAFRLYLVRRGEVVWRTRVQVGRPYRQTPVFRAELTYLVFNPTWTVPPTILRQDILPEVRRDVSYLAARHIEVIDAAGKRVDPAAVDWSARSLPYRLVQTPGADNALGRVKFMLPNDHAVYLHDTPSRDLFEQSSRAFSSGCIRVENPFELAELLLGRTWPRERLDALVASGRTETVFLARPMTVMLLYWTAEPDERGRVTFYPDLYARDRAVIEALAQPFDARAVL